MKPEYPGNKHCHCWWHHLKWDHVQIKNNRINSCFFLCAVRYLKGGTRYSSPFSPQTTKTCHFSVTAGVNANWQDVSWTSDPVGTAIGILLRCIFGKLYCASLLLWHLNIHKNPSQLLPLSSRVFSAHRVICHIQLLQFFKFYPRSFQWQHRIYQLDNVFIIHFKTYYSRYLKIMTTGSRGWGIIEARQLSPSAPIDTSLTPLLQMKSKALFTLAILWKRILPLSGLGSLSPKR